MVVAVDGRHLAAARGVARYSRRMLAALAACEPSWAVRALVAGSAPVAPVEGVQLVRTALPGRLLNATAAVTGRPTVATLCGDDGRPADVVWLPAPAPVAAGRPFVLTIHDLAWIERPADFTCYERFWHRLIALRRLVGTAAAVVCDCAQVAEQLAARFDVARPVVIEPGGDAIGGPPPTAERSPWPRPYLLYVGALEPRKGLDLLAAAWPRADLDADLLVVGSGRVRVPGAQLLGHVDDLKLAALYRHALALVLPSRLEGFGLTPREAAAHGTPSIVADLPSLKMPGTLTFPAGDSAALAAAIAALPAARPRLVAQLRPPRSWAQAAEALATVLATAATTTDC